MAKTEYPPEFEQAWDLYPRRPNNNKRKALKAWNARLRDGYTPEELIAGLRAYLSWAEKQGMENEYLKHTSTFFGPDLHFLDFTGADLPSDEEIQEMNESGPDEELLRYYQEEELI